ncbi:MAG: hypothetical protein ACI4R8_03010, partial [Candidatus Caccovivens sp.]
MNEEIKRPRNFLPKMFKVFTLYIIVTLSVFFGYVEFFGDVPPVLINLIQDDAGAEDDNPFSGFLVSLGNFQNVHAEGINLTFENKDMLLNVVGDVTVDMQNNIMSFDVDMTYNGNIFDVGAVYTQPYLYLTIENSTYKFDTTTNSSGTLDITGLLDFVAKNINIDLSFLNDIGNALGIDFENLDVSNLQSMLDVSDSKELEDGGFEIIVRLGNVISAQILCDENYSVTSARLKDNIVIKGNAIKFNAPNVQMNSQSVADKIVVPDEESVIDMTGATQFVTFGQNLFANDFVSGQVDINANGQNYTIHLLFDNEETFKVKAFANIDGIDLSITYTDNTVYVDAEKLKLKFGIEDYNKWDTEINLLVEKYTGKTVSEILQEYLSKITEVDEENLYSNFLNIFDEAFSNSEKINSYLPDSTSYAEHEFVMLWENGLQVAMTEQNQMLSNVTAQYLDIEIVANFVVAENGVSVVGEYYDVTNLLSLSSFVDKVLEIRQIGGTASIYYQDNSIDVTFAIDFSEELAAKIAFNLLGEDVECYLQGDRVLLCVGDVVVEGNFAQLDEYLNRINEIFAFELNVDGVSTETILLVVTNILQNINLASNQDEFMFVEYLTHNIGFAVDGDILNVNYNYDSWTVSASIEAMEVEIVVPNVTDETLDLLEKVANVKEFAEC